MRRYIVPLLLFSAIGVVIVVYVRSQGNEDPREPARETEAVKEAAESEAEAAKTLLDRGGRETPTRLSRSKWLSELERVLERDDLSNAHHYRAKLCEHMEQILEDDVLVRNLIAAIRKYAIDSRDPEKRKLLLPILRVLTTPEATRLVEEEYYRTTDESERLVLLDAMTNPKHNPEIAGVWAAEMAVNSEDPEHRHTAYLFIRNLPMTHQELVVRTSKQIYESSTRPEQRVRAIYEVARRADDSENGREFLRSRLRDARESELESVINFIETWGTLRDAILLESLAARFPAMAQSLRNRAEKIRTMRRMEEDPELAKAMLKEKERAERERNKEPENE